MEYFDFEHASHAPVPFDADETSSTMAEVTEAESQACYESLFYDKTASLPKDAPSASRNAPTTLTLINNSVVEVVPHMVGLDSGMYPMFRAKEPCDLCRKMGLDCFLASRGTLINGCTCCISLYRECSFTHQKDPKSFYITFPGISEDAQVCEGSMQERKVPMRSFEESRPRKSGARFSRDAVKLLKQWLANHASRPYPTDQEKDELKRLTGLKRSQISNWLANARRRGKVLPLSTPCSPMLGAVDIPARPRDENAELNPLDRWKASPPESEPASFTAIARAVASTPYPARNSSSSSLQNSRANSSRQTSSNDGSGMSMFQAPSVSSLETGQSSASDLSRLSNRSHRSKGSFASSTGEKDRRRRRRAPVAQRTAAQHAKSRSARIFQCTFCTDSFPSKYDWQRHEKSLHLALERWTCCPNGGVVEVPITGCRHCVFCQEPNPTLEHLETHSYALCQEKTPQERTFYRKDHLRQHLKLLHNVKFDPAMEAWKSATTEIRSRCGFCPSVFSTWQQRADHLAAHFRNGSDMSGWVGGWGFEPYVEQLVEDAMPPYMIAQEKASMDPFVAKPHATPASGSENGLTFGVSASPSSDGYQMAKDSNCWGRLEQELIKYVSQQKLLGITASDEDLKRKSRMIIYDDDDPWNQTPADNQQWLDTLKFQVGLSDCPHALQKLEEVPILPPYVVRGGLRQARQNAGKAQCGVMTPSTESVPVAILDQGMDIDFDELDFSGLDLGLLDDTGFEGIAQSHGLDIGGHNAQMPSSKGGLEGFVTSNGMANGFMLENDMGMSEADMNQLSSFMAGFT